MYPAKWLHIKDNFLKIHKKSSTMLHATCQTFYYALEVVFSWDIKSIALDQVTFRRNLGC